MLFSHLKPFPGTNLVWFLFCRLFLLVSIYSTLLTGLTVFIQRVKIISSQLESNQLVRHISKSYYHISAVLAALFFTSVLVSTYGVLFLLKSIFLKQVVPSFYYVLNGCYLCKCSFIIVVIQLNRNTVRSVGTATRQHWIGRLNYCYN